LTWNAANFSITYDCELLILKKALDAQTDEFFPERLDKKSFLEVLNKPARR
jgi:hypothetical protein